MKKGRYVEVSREKLERFLVTCGFSPRRSGKELVYVRANTYHPDVFVKVYTTLPAAGGNVRGCGRDAIRVTVAYESDKPFRGKTSLGLFKATKILRTGSEELVLDRLYNRMQEAYTFSNVWLRRHWDEIKQVGATS